MTGYSHSAISPHLNKQMADNEVPFTGNSQVDKSEIDKQNKTRSMFYDSSNSCKDYVYFLFYFSSPLDSFTSVV